MIVTKEEQVVKFGLESQFEESQHYFNYMILMRLSKMLAIVLNE